MGKINIWSIIRRHYETLRDDSTKKSSVSDYLLFFGVPFLAAASGFYFHWSLAVEALAAVLASFTIFAGLLFNFLILVYTLATDEQPNALARGRGDSMRELHENIAYSVLVSVFIVLFSLVATIVLKHGETVSAPSRLQFALTAVINFLVCNFFLTLLMVLKRIHTILRNKLDKPNFSNSRAS
jgi:hypothetical protein